MVETYQTTNCKKTLMKLCEGGFRNKPSQHQLDSPTNYQYQQTDPTCLWVNLKQLGKRQNLPETSGSKIPSPKKQNNQYPQQGKIPPTKYPLGNRKTLPRFPSRCLRRGQVLPCGAQILAELGEVSSAPSLWIGRFALVWLVWFGWFDGRNARGI